MFIPDDVPLCPDCKRRIDIRNKQRGAVPNKAGARRASGVPIDRTVVVTRGGRPVSMTEGLVH